VKLEAADLMKPCGMKTVFISASPVLVNEVSRFYRQLKDALIATLQKRERLGFETIDKDVETEHGELMQLA